ncbi:MAG: hypothetical protein JWO00_401 [Candidatus Parcubacteria bacterium]|nr:hypothetical protein [Candidatus Parcubacteria bacterium]
MSRASDNMSTVAAHRQKYGYLYFLSGKNAGKDYTECELEIRFRNYGKCSSYYVHASHIKRDIREYHLLVCTGEDEGMQSLISGAVAYVDQYHITIDTEELKYSDFLTEETAHTLLYVLHAVMYRHILDSDAKENGINAWWVGFFRYEIRFTEESSDVSIEEFIQTMHELLHAV